MKKLLFLIILLSSVGFAEDLKYVGFNQLCIVNTTGNETCLSHGDTYTYDSTQDYLLKLNPRSHSYDIKTIFQEGITPERILFLGATLILIFFASIILYAVI